VVEPAASPSAAVFTDDSVLVLPPEAGAGIPVPVTPAEVLVPTVIALLVNVEVVARDTVELILLLSP
jgi:hypothetical protein